MKSIEDKIYKRITRNGPGWIFSGKEFLDLGSNGAVRLSLLRLTKEGKIRKVIRGLYEYPRYSKLLKESLVPDLDQVAKALARKFCWRIQATGNIALNLLGLSTQVPAKSVYLSDGPGKKYIIGKRTLEFKKTSFKDSDIKRPASALLVQAIKALGQERINDTIIESIRKNLSDADRKKALSDTKYVSGWIHDVIQQICRKDAE